LAYGGRDVPEQTLCDALWSDEEGDAAANALAITVVRLRKLLGRRPFLTSAWGYRLKEQDASESRPS